MACLLMQDGIMVLNGKKKRGQKVLTSHPSLAFLSLHPEAASTFYTLSNLMLLNFQWLFV